MDASFIMLALVVLLALAFDYTNGFHDSANAIATIVSTRVLRPTTAVIYGGILNFVGAMMGTEVAATIGKGLVDASVLNTGTVLCTVATAIVWNLLTWWRGLPTSSSHALIGALIGAAAASAGTGAVKGGAILSKVVGPMVLSPVMGFIAGFALMTALTWIIHKLKPGLINRLFGRLQIVSAGFMALNHGRNDAQKSMGIIALALLLAHPGAQFAVPLWVKLSCALAMGAGTMSGGWRIVRTLGSKMIKLQPVHGFAAETTASIILGVTAHFGIPVSTTHVISTSILGVGATKRLSAVRWGIVGNIVWAWVLTIPFTALLSGLLMMLGRALAG